MTTCTVHVYVLAHNNNNNNNNDTPCLYIDDVSKCFTEGYIITQVIGFRLACTHQVPI